MNQYPNSTWAIAWEAQLGGEYYRVGRYSRAIAAWEHAWNSGKDAGAKTLNTTAHRAAGELALMYARLGRMTGSNRMSR